MVEGTITAVEVQDTEYGEKLAIQSPFDAKDFVKVLPWKAYSEEVEEHGSLKAKAVDRGMSEDNVAIEAAESFDFSDDFSTHASWDPNGLGYEDGCWTIDVDAWDEAAEFFEHAGFDTDVNGEVNV